MGGHMDQDLASRYLRPVTVPPWNTCKSVWPPSEIPAQTGIPHLYNVSFNSVGLMVSSALCSLQIDRRPESLSIVNLDSSVNSTEAHCCCVQETCSLAQHKRFLRCRPLRERTQLVFLRYRACTL
ncbi:hypothetical protein TNCV_3220021 [Trichonephila clavipes]|nr:hypothetical protein TNCV_3220021 [Trichonephila clavipes]